MGVPVVCLSKGPSSHSPKTGEIQHDTFVMHIVKSAENLRQRRQETVLAKFIT